MTPFAFKINAVRSWSRALAMALVWLSFSGAAFAQNLVLNHSFETAGQASWTKIQPDAPGLVFQDDPFFSVTDGLNGVRNSNPNGALILYQDVALPPTGTYTIQMSIGAGSLANGANNFVRADITNTNAATLVAPTAADTLGTTGGNVLQALFSRDGSGGPNPIAIADTAQFNISALAGTTVRVRIMVRSTSGQSSVTLDNVRLIRTNSVSSVPTLSEWAMLALAGLMALATFVSVRRRFS
jgi:hypothetical protein